MRCNVNPSYVEQNRAAIDAWSADDFVMLGRVVVRSTVLPPLAKLVFGVLAGFQYKSSRAKGIYPTLEQIACACGARVAEVELALHRLRYGHDDLAKHKRRRGWKALVTWLEVGGRRYYRIRAPTADRQRQLGG